MENNSSTRTLLSNPKRAQEIPFSDYARFFFALKYIRLYKNNKPLDRREAWEMGYKNPNDILQLQTDLDYKKTR